MMKENINLKDKILALFTVLVLFFIMSTVLGSVSYNNKIKTENLRLKVLEQRKQALIQQKINSISLATSTLQEVNSRAFLTAVVVDGQVKKILQEKNADLVLPIASISKLLVATVAKENINLQTEVTATEEYIAGEESFFVIESNRKYLIKDIMANALISSDNDSARMLAGIFGENVFLEKVNQKAKELGMNSTSFVNSTGLDTKDPVNMGLNVSTANDLLKLVLYIEEKHPEILAFTKNREFNFCDINSFCKVVNNTNKLLINPDFPLEIVGSKTGTTDLALKNLVLVTKIYDDVYLISIALGSEDHFADTLKLINNIIINK